MKTLFWRTGVFALCLLASAFAAPAQAEIVRLTNGRTMTVESCAFDGNDVILNLHGGGMIRAPRSIVAELLPDEIPYARATALEALAVSPTASRVPLAEAVIRDLVDRLADDAKVDRRLVHAVIRVESNYQPLAVSSKGAMGLMQLMPATARQYELDDAFDPEKNLRAGILHLKGLLQRFDISRAVAAYNAGEGAVARYGGVPPYRETQEYVRRVLALYRQQ